MSNQHISDSLSIGTETHHNYENKSQQKGGALSGPWNPWSAFWNTKKINTNDKAHVALDKGNFGCFEFFIDEDMITDYNTVHNGDTILHRLVQLNKPELLEKALNHHNGPVDVQDAAGNTVAVLAVKNNFPTKILDLLKQKGADLTVKNKEGVYVMSDIEEAPGTTTVPGKYNPTFQKAESEDTEKLLENLKLKYGIQQVEQLTQPIKQIQEETKKDIETFSNSLVQGELLIYFPEWL